MKGIWIKARKKALVNMQLLTYLEISDCLSDC